MSITVSVCQTCDGDAEGVAAGLAAALVAAGIAAQVRRVDCMSGCTRPATIAFRATGKTAYLFGDCTPDDIADLVTFARLYAAAPDGNLGDARPLGSLRQKAIARIPA